jgi:hypothetical protein
VYCDSDDDDAPPIFYRPIDIGPPGPYRSEHFDAQLFIPAAALDDGQSITFELLHSDDEQSGYTSLDASITARVTGSGGNGSPQRTLLFQLPVDAKRYLIVSATCDDGADVSATEGSTFSLSLLF